MNKQTTLDIFETEQQREILESLDHFDDINLDTLDMSELSEGVSIDTDELLNLTKTININVANSDLDDIVINDFSTIDITEYENDNFKDVTNDMNISVSDDIKSNIIIDSRESDLKVEVITEPIVEKPKDFSSVIGMANAFENMVMIENSKSEEIKISVEEQIKTLKEDTFGKVKILVIGVGSCGCNAIDRMYSEKIDDIKLVAIDTSEQTLENISADYKMLIGEREFGGHGSGQNVSKTEIAFESAKPKLQNILQGVDMLFVAGGIGNGTGSVGLCRIGQYAREMGILTLGFATLPRNIETNGEIARQYYDNFIESVDSSIIVENEKIFSVASNLPVREAMKIADSMLVDGIKGIFELITKPGKINLDYADIKTAFKNQGAAVMGIGYGQGQDAVVSAINQALHSEIIDFENVHNAQTVIFNITCPPRSVTIDEASRGTDLIYSLERGNNIKHLFFGYSYDESLENEVKVTFIATGTTHPVMDFDRKPQTKSFTLGGNNSGLDIKRDSKENAFAGLSLSGLGGIPKRDAKETVVPSFSVADEEEPLFKKNTETEVKSSFIPDFMKK